MLHSKCVLKYSMQIFKTGSIEWNYSVMALIICICWNFGGKSTSFTYGVKNTYSSHLPLIVKLIEHFINLNEFQQNKKL